MHTKPHTELPVLNRYENTKPLEQLAIRLAWPRPNRENTVLLNTKLLNQYLQTHTFKIKDLAQSVRQQMKQIFPHNFFGEGPDTNPNKEHLFKPDLTEQWSFGLEITTGNGKNSLMLNRADMSEQDFSADLSKLDIPIASQDILPIDPHKGVSFKLDGILDELPIQKIELAGINRWQAYEDQPVTVATYRVYIPEEMFYDVVKQNTKAQIVNLLDIASTRGWRQTVTPKVQAVVQKGLNIPEKILAMINRMNPWYG